MAVLSIMFAPLNKYSVNAKSIVLNLANARMLFDAPSAAVKGICKLCLVASGRDPLTSPVRAFAVLSASTKLSVGKVYL